MATRMHFAALCVCGGQMFASLFLVIEDCALASPIFFRAHVFFFVSVCFLCARVSVCFSCIRLYALAGSAHMYVYVYVLMCVCLCVFVCMRRQYTCVYVCVYV